MVGIIDATRLAFTKLKTRKVRLIVTLVISSLLFSILFAASFAVRGSIGSVENFSKSGFGNRFIVSGQEMLDPNGVLANQDLIAQARAAEKDVQARKKAEAKRLGIDYDPKADQPFVNEASGPNQQPLLNDQIPEVQATIVNHLKSQPTSRAKFEAVVKKYDAKNVYVSMPMQQVISQAGNQSSITYIKDGKESTPEQGKPEAASFSMPGRSDVSSVTQQWQLISRELMTPFVLPGQHTQIGQDGSVPIIAPYSAAENYLKLQPLSKSVGADEKLARLKDVRSRIAGKTIDICYRNQTSLAMMQFAQQQQDEVNRNKDNKNYIKPSLIYALPKEACGPVTVERDVRTKEEKDLASKQEQFERTFGKVAPESEMIKLRIVGLNSDFGFSGGISVVDVVQSILISNLGFGWFSPIEATQTHTLLKRLNDPNAPTASQAQSYYADLPTAGHVKRLLDNENCAIDFMSTEQGATFDPTKQCREQGKPFMMNGFGSSSVALDQFKSGFNRVLIIVSSVFAIIAALILMGTVGRIIADSRRETAVFRAIGAKRLDIAQIYLTYTLMIAGLILLVSSTVGFVIAQFVERRYSDDLTVSSLVAFNVTDYTKRFNMMGIDPKDILFIAGIILGATLLAASLPLLTNIRRNPIRDMRDDR